MKISIQEKIAELEARIADLERNADAHTGFAASFHGDTQAASHWERVWEHFDKLFKRVEALFG